MTNNEDSYRKYHEDYNTRNPLNGIACKEGEVLVPILAQEISDLYKQDKENKALCQRRDIILDNLETWHLGGRKILVGFVAAKREQADACTEHFWNEVNAFLDSTRKKRCIIYDEKKRMYKRCPRGKSCDFCQKETYTSYELSLNEFLEGDDETGDGSWDPTGGDEEESAEAIAVLRNTLSELIVELFRLDPTMAKCISLLAQGYQKNEVIEELNLDLKKSQAYAYVEKCQKKAKEIYDKKYR